MVDDFGVWTPSWYDWHTWPRSDMMPRYEALTIRRTGAFLCPMTYLGIFAVFPKVSVVMLIYSTITG